MEREIVHRKIISNGESEKQVAQSSKDLILPTTQRSKRYSELLMKHFKQAALDLQRHHVEKHYVYHKDVQFTRVCRSPMIKGNSRRVNLGGCWVRFVAVTCTFRRSIEGVILLEEMDFDILEMGRASQRSSPKIRKCTILGKQPLRITTRYGYLEYTVMHFGLTNAPSLYYAPIGRINGLTRAYVSPVRGQWEIALGVTL
jgi:hypothetical protein